MLKKSVLALAVLIVGLALAAPKANAQVAIGVTIGRPVVRPYVVAPAPVVVAPAPVVVARAPYAYAPAPAYVPSGVWIAGRWYPRAYAYRHAYWRPRPYYRRWYR
ncbi:MAG TPA: hypothetical protein VMT82_09095 [candidate division Zixibacteria bacterium]|nr:hypothetical protein [candidate division Zixibacteria bacterium]